MKKAIHLLCVLFILFLLTATVMAEEKLEVHWIVDTWEVTPINPKLMHDSSMFSEEQWALFASDADRYAHVWFSGWLIEPVKRDVEYQKILLTGETSGVYVGRYHMVHDLESSQYGNQNWYRMSFLVVVDQEQVTVENAVTQIFTVTNPHLPAYESKNYKNIDKEITLIEPDVSLLQRRDVPEDYFDHVHAEILRVYPATEDLRYKIIFDRGAYGEFNYGKGRSYWFVDLRLSNDKYPMPIRCVYNFFGEEGKNKWLGFCEGVEFWFFGELEQGNPNPNGVFTGWLHVGKEDVTAEEVMRYILEEEFSCWISFEPNIDSDSKWVGTCGPWYPYVFRYEEIREYPHYSG